MSGLLRSTVMAMSLTALIVASTPSRSQDAPWVVVNSAKACGASRGPVMIGSPDGVKYGLFVSDVTVGDQALRPVLVDGKPFLLRFAQNGSGAFADLDSAVMGALSTGGRLTLDWGDRHIEAVTGELMPALNKVQACGAQLEKQRLAEVQRKKAAARERADFDAFAAAVEAGSRTSHTPSRLSGTGMICGMVGEAMTGPYRSCAYNCGGRRVTKTIDAVELCPIEIER